MTWTCDPGTQRFDFIAGCCVDFFFLICVCVDAIKVLHFLFLFFLLFAFERDERLVGDGVTMLACDSCCFAGWLLLFVSHRSCLSRPLALVSSRSLAPDHSPPTPAFFLSLFSLSPLHFVGLSRVLPHHIISLGSANAHATGGRESAKGKPLKGGGERERSPQWGEQINWPRCCVVVSWPG